MPRHLEQRAIVAYEPIFDRVLIDLTPNLNERERFLLRNGSIVHFPLDSHKPIGLEIPDAKLDLSSTKEFTKHQHVTFAGKIRQLLEHPSEIGELFDS